MTDSWEHIASLYQGRRVVGGRMRVADGRLDFEPHILDRKTGGRPLSVSLGSITSIERTERSWNPATFSPRRCLRIRTADGVEAKLLVNGLDALIPRLEQAVREASAG